MKKKAISVATVALFSFSLLVLCFHYLNVYETEISHYEEGVIYYVPFGSQPFAGVSVDTITEYPLKRSNTQERQFLSSFYKGKNRCWVNWFNSRNVRLSFLSGDKLLLIDDNYHLLYNGKCYSLDQKSVEEITNLVERNQRNLSQDHLRIQM